MDKPKIFDCFIFFNEISLLEFRLEYLNDVVDYFVINEATKTHSGNPKELIFKNNVSRFKKWNNKIIYSEISFPDSITKPMDRDMFQRAMLFAGLEGIHPESILLVSDLDEIPRINIVEDTPVFSIENPDFIAGCVQEIFYFYINRLDTSRKWIGTAISNMKTLCKYQIDANKMRQVVRGQQASHYLPEGGWHFAWLGNAKDAKYKLESYAHQEYNTPEYNDLFRIEEIVKDPGRDIFREGVKHKIIPVTNEFYPELIANNISKYKDLGWIAEEVK